MSDTALIIIARYPEPGKTKTRLARVLGNTETAQLYRAFLTDLAQRFAGQQYALHWAYTPAEADYQALVQTFVPAWSQSMHYFPQQGADLGERLQHAFRWTHQQGFKRTILIGSDSPHISREIVAQAETALDDADIVLGPADDGGYYLIGMHKPHDVFSGIPMSTEVVTQMTIEAASRQGLKTHLIEQLFDIDELSDLSRLAQLLDADSMLAPVTAKTMRSFHDYHARINTATLDLHRADQSL